jgi:hypothetical protein
MTGQSPARTAITKSFEQVIDETNRYFHSSESTFSFEQYKAMQLDQDYFIELAGIIREELRQPVTVSAAIKGILR